MLALLLSCLIGFSGVKAQMNTEYSFRQQSVIDQQSYGETAGPGTGDPVPVLTTECLAANGYGQWTLSTQPGSGTGGASAYGLGWYLLENTLNTPSTHYDPNNHAPGDITGHPECIPPGVVQNGPFGMPLPALPTIPEPKVTANLNGAVTYVWPNPNNGPGGTSREDFIVQGFRSTDINLSLSFLSNAHTPMNIVGQQYTSNIPTVLYTNISTGTPPNNVTTTAPYQDEFDVCSDAAYLYIAWCSTKTNPLGQIFFEVVDINTMAPIVLPTLAGIGMRPTVACDPRNNRNGGASPKFELAYIAPQLQGGNYVYVGTAPHNGGNLAWETYTSGGLVPHAPLNPFVLDPSNSANPPIYYAFVTHAHALVSSVEATGAWHAACYAIVDLSGFSLILYNADDPMVGPTGNAAYVEGQLLPAPDEQPAGPIPVPPPHTPPILGWPVKDAPIVAFANPYDNQIVSTDMPADWRGYDQFHCLYQLDLSPVQPAGMQYPLFIVRNSDNGETNPIQPNPNGDVNDTRLLLNQLETNPPPPQPQLLPDPTTYCATVNQIGIHVHWRVGVAPNGMHFYARSSGQTTNGHYCGSFDEPIEENTLVTDTCSMSNGTWHGGTSGATVGNGLQMTLWTDPNYGASSTDPQSGLLQFPTEVDPGDGNTHHVSALVFTDNGAMLNIGSVGTIGVPAPAVLSMVPLFYVFFNGSAQGISVFGNFDYWGRLDNRTGSLKSMLSPFLGGGTIEMATWIYQPICDICDGIVEPSTLTVHGGSDFYMEDDDLFEVDGGAVDVRYEPNFYPITNGTTNTNTTGHLTLLGSNTFTNAGYLAHLPSGDNEVTLSCGGGVTSGYQFSATGSAFTNYPNSGTSQLLFGFQSDPVGGDLFSESVSFDNDQFTATNIHVVNPTTSLGNPDQGIIYLANSTFSEMHGKTIFIENTNDPTGLDESNYNAPITLSNNTFTSINSVRGSDNDNDDDASGSYGIYIKGIDGNYNEQWSNMIGNILVENNSFDDSDFSHDATLPEGTNDRYSAAICFENTTGNIISNSISDYGYSNGIWLKARPFDNQTPTSNSLLCSNTVQDLWLNTSYDHWNLFGMRLENYTGWLRWNTIKHCEAGISTLLGGSSHFIGNSVDLDHPWEVVPDPPAEPYQIDATTFVRPLQISESTVDLSGKHIGGDDIPGYNSFRMSGNPSGVIVLSNSTSGLILGNQNEPWSSNYGMNNIYVRDGHCDQFNDWPCAEDNDPEGLIADLASSSYYLHNIDYNFWGYDDNSNLIDPANEANLGAHHWNLSQPSQTNASNITFDIPSNTQQGPISANGTPSCSSNYSIVRPKQLKPQSAKNADSAPSSCQLSFAWGYQYTTGGPPYHYDWAYDTLTAFVQHCPTYPDTWQAFGLLSTDVQNGGNGPYPGCWPPFKQWLLDALAWNPGDSRYFCTDVRTLAGALTMGIDTTWQQINTGTNRSLSVIYWLIHNPLCYEPDDTELYEGGRGSQRGTWIDTQDTSKVKLDTTIYSMHDLGLDSVLKYAVLLGVHEPGMESILSNATAYPNPTGMGTELSFTTSKEAYVLVKLYNVLGQTEGATSFENVLEPGNHQVPISLQGLPSGTYYARIQTTYGEVQTVKLVKE